MPLTILQYDTYKPRIKLITTTMTDFLFIQKFENGKIIKMPYLPLMVILSRYGDSGRGLGDLEIILPHREIAASCTVIGDETGISCIGFERPSYCDKLQSLAWACMQELGCAVFNDTLTLVHFPKYY